MKVEVDVHTKTDKSFYITINGVNLKVDYDDVDHERVDATISTLESMVFHHWDEYVFHDHWKNNLRKRWSDDLYLRHDYPSFESFASDLGCVTPDY